MVALGRLAAPLVDISYIRRWVPIATLIGVVSGVGAILFHEAITLITQLSLAELAGYVVPTPVGEGGSPPSLPLRPYLIPLITALGGLASGLLVFVLAPEAEGHGTDAAIDAYHNKKGEIRSRVPIVKLVASALTIGSGGSAGREGPTAQMSAGLGSLLGALLHLNRRDRRIAVAVGIGSGIGSIFKAPFGGALLAAEILYLKDLEVEVLLPAFIASAVGYSIFASVKGWTPIFGIQDQYAFHEPLVLPLYGLLGVVCGLIGIAYVKSFYSIRALFQRLALPNFLKPALGGLAVGLIGMFLPQVLGMGYGWLQEVMVGDLSTFPLALILLIIGAKILATSLTVGSGGSGGVFAPALVIGGMIGAAVWSAFHRILPELLPSPTPFVIVGMMSFFGGVGKAPIAVILMVSEMTGAYTLLVPSMIATSIAYVLTGRNTIYSSQVATRAESPAHRGEYSIPLLQRLTVKDAMSTRVITIGPEATLVEASRLMMKHRIKGMPVMDRNWRMVGIVTLSDILQVPQDKREVERVGSIMSKRVLVAQPTENLYQAFRKMMANEIGRLPVIDSSNGGRLVGILTRTDIGKAYELELKAELEEGGSKG